MCFRLVLSLRKKLTVLTGVKNTPWYDNNSSSDELIESENETDWRISCCRGVMSELDLKQLVLSEH